MNLQEYASFDGLGLAELVAKGEVSPKELALTARQAIEAENPWVNAVVETYEDRIEGLDEPSLGAGPFRGVPFLIKDVGGHEKGRKIEYGSRLCEGMVAEYDTYFYKLLKASGVNVLGRSNTPEYSIAGSAENLLYGNTSNPWREGFSAGGSTGGGAAAVSAGMVPLAHGSDIAGSIRIPAAWCGGVGLKPSRGLISAGPVLDEGGLGLSMNFVQSKTIRDTAAMLDCLSAPQPGDPFVIRRPDHSYLEGLKPPPSTMRIALAVAPLMDAPIDPEIAMATRTVAAQLAEAGYEVEEAAFPFDHEEASRHMAYFWFFGFDKQLDGYAQRTGRKIGPETLEPVTLALYYLARKMDPAKFLDAQAFLNRARREIGRFFTKYDLFLSPTTAICAPPHGPYGLNHPGMDPVEYIRHGDRPVQYCFPFNVTGGPAISLPLALHPTGLPIGIQLGGRPSEDHLVLAIAALLEELAPWAGRRAIRRH